MNVTIETPTTQNRSHHRYGPSKLNYLDDCAAFESRSGTSEAAERGTFLHTLAEQMLNCVKSGKATNMVSQMSQWVTEKHELDDSEIAALRYCAEKVDSFLAYHPTAIEQEVQVVLRRHDESVFNSGYLDVWLEFGKTAILIDYKFGVEPVRPAHTNLQGMCYAAAQFQTHPNIERIAVCFIQPKIDWTSEHIYIRADLPGMFELLSQVVMRAEHVRSNPQQAQNYMAPGHYCKYCARAGNCALLANHMAVATTKYSDLPVPPAFKGLELTRPEDVALARYWVDILEVMASEIKERAHAAAKASADGSISCTLPNGKEIRYGLRTRKSPRSLGSAIEVAEALSEWLTPQEVLGAADLKITKLEPIVKRVRSEAAKASGTKLTKKAAWEETCGYLEAVGLITQDDNVVEYLKLIKEPERALPDAK